MRSKEDAQDYRYFPDPDLVPIIISDEWMAEVKSKEPEFRDEKMARYILKQQYKRVAHLRKQATGLWVKQCV